MGRRLAAILGLSLTATLLPALPLAAQTASADPDALTCAMPTHVVDGGSTEPLALGVGETVLLQSGAFTGALDALPVGSLLCVAADATLSPPQIGSIAGRIRNAGTMIVPGFDAGQGLVLENSGSLLVAGRLTVAADGRIDNVCRLTVRGALSNAGALNNSGTIGLAAGGLHNSGTVRQDQQGVVTGVDLTNDGSITGGGGYRFSGQTTNGGSVSGDAGDQPIVVEDTTPTGPGPFDADTGQASNVIRATVTAAPTDRPVGCTTPDPEPVADIAVRVAGPSTAAGGAAATLEITVTNMGPDAAEHVVAFADFLPPDFKPHSTHDDAVASKGSVTWRLGTLALGEARRLTVEGTAPAAGEITYRVSTWSSTPDPAPANNDGSLPGASGATVVTRPAPEGPTQPPEPAPGDLPQPPMPAPQPATPPTNRPPVVEDADVTTTAMTDATGTIEASDADPGQAVTLSLVQPATSGRVDVDSGGQFRYSPVGGFTGRDDFTVRGCDDGAPARCDDATISITVLPAPRDDTVMTWAGKPIGVDVDGNDLGGASPPDWVVGPQHGSAVTGPTMVYTPGGSYTGWDTMTYQRCAPEAPDVCAQATLKVGVLPLAEDDFFSTPEGRAFLAVAAANDFGDTGDFTIINDPDFGNVEEDPDGDFLYTPDEGFVGEDSFTYQVCSPNAPDLCDVGVVTMRVDDVIEPAAAVDEADSDEMSLEAGAHTDAGPRVSSGSGLSPGPVLAAGLVVSGLLALTWRWRRIRARGRPQESSA
jgi:uncharacterized repeat protein (TIGR01451 family)